MVTDEYDELIISGDFNSDSNQGRFFKELKYFIDAFELDSPDMDTLPYEFYAYISRYINCTISWLDELLTSTNNIVTNLYSFSGDAIEDHTCEI